MVCLLCWQVSFAKTAELIEIPFRVWSCGAQETIHWVGADSPQKNGQSFLGRHVHVRLIWAKATLCFILVQIFLRKWLFCGGFAWNDIWMSAKVDAVRDEYVALCQIELHYTLDMRQEWLLIRVRYASLFISWIMCLQLSRDALSDLELDFELARRRKYYPW